MSVTTARPINERIAATLYARLRLLTADYVGTTKIKEVVRPTLRGNYTPKHLQVVLTQDDPERAPDFDRPGNPPSIGWEQRFDIRCHVMPSETDTTPVAEYINTISADVVLAVTTGSVQWHNFDGLAIDAEWQSRETIDEDGSFGGINVPLSVLYRVEENDPYQARA